MCSIFSFFLIPTYSSKMVKFPDRKKAYGILQKYLRFPINSPIFDHVHCKCKFVYVHLHSLDFQEMYNWMNKKK